MKPKQGFSAFSVPGYSAFLTTFTLTMMADNIEHVISYYVIFQKFKSPALAGFAVISHWLPFLIFSLPVGALNDKYDSRRLIQIGGTLFLLASVGWGYFFFTDSLQMHYAMFLLVLHGFAGVFWMTSSQVLLYDIVGPLMLPSAVRLMATARYLATFIGPGIGSLLMLGIGTTYGIWLNTIFYLPLLIWLATAPYGRHLNQDVKSAMISKNQERQKVSGWADMWQTIIAVKKIPILSIMMIVVGAASFFVGNSYQPQMPEFAADLGRGDPGVAYAVLLGADASGALLGGILLESRGGVFALRTRSVLILATCWAISLAGFALSSWYYVAILFLFGAGFFELSFSSMSQTIVQMNAPDEIRGKVLGLFNVASSGLRLFSGITVGLVGSAITIHTSLAGASLTFMLVCVMIAFAIMRTYRHRVLQN